MTLWGREETAFQVAVSFLKTRLDEYDTVQWALNLKASQRIERMAVSFLLSRPSEFELVKPWATAWHLIEESWNDYNNEDSSHVSRHDIQDRLEAGERSGFLVSAIARLAAPRLKVESANTRWLGQASKPRRPKSAHDLLWPELTSIDLDELGFIDLEEIGEVSFLVELGNALESAVDRGLAIAHRIGWDGSSPLLGGGEPNRIRYLNFDDTGSAERDLDAFNNGLAPAVKLLYAVVVRIATVQPKLAKTFFIRWREAGSPLHTRMWSEIDLNSVFVSPEEVGAFLLGLDDRKFWDLHFFPEIAELRARRFCEFDAETQDSVIKRLQRRPPRSHWPRDIDLHEINQGRLYWAVRELRRIEVAGGTLPERAKSWLESKIQCFPDLATMSICEGFLYGRHQGPSDSPAVDDGYEAVTGIARLERLEAAISGGERKWLDPSSDGALEWLGADGNALLVLKDLESVENGGDQFPTVWNRFGWEHKPEHVDPQGTSQADLRKDAKRVLGLLEKLSEKTLSKAIEGVSYWLFNWVQHTLASPACLRVWSRVWPIAVEATNARGDPRVEERSLVRDGTGHASSIESDTLNTPTGRLVEVFISVLPSLREVPEPFAANKTFREMRNKVINCDQASRVIAQYRLIRDLPYFHKADCEWTLDHLIEPLRNGGEESLDFWQAAAKQTLFKDVLEEIGEEVVEAVLDGRLHRNSRGMLVFSLVVEALHSFLENRDPAVPFVRIQKMLRSVDDDLRAKAARAIERFVREVSNSSSDESSRTADQIFRAAAKPFLRNVWPQELSFRTRHISYAFAQLPEASGQAFEDAFEEIKRFLVPMSIRSMRDYGFKRDSDKRTDLATVCDEKKAGALLHLLDLTVGTSEDSVVPRELPDALNHIQEVSPSLKNDKSLRRLLAVSRR